MCRVLAAPAIGQAEMRAKGLQAFSRGRTSLTLTIEKPRHQSVSGSLGRLQQLGRCQGLMIPGEQLGAASSQAEESCAQ